MADIRFILNGKEVAYEGSYADRLLDVLRDTYRCTSVKCGCKEGECGACSVLIDGTLINSCCVAMGAVCGASIVTMEGFRETERFAALEKAFGETSAVQCGFCIPGMIISAKSTPSAPPTTSRHRMASAPGAPELVGHRPGQGGGGLCSFQ